MTEATHRDERLISTPNRICCLANIFITGCVLGGLAFWLLACTFGAVWRTTR